jgi:hypothetical protein
LDRFVANNVPVGRLSWRPRFISQRFLAVIATTVRSLKSHRFMSDSPISLLIRLRLLVAFLGEKKQFGWWDTSFLDATGRSFLERPFPRTALQAALRSSSAAAAAVHDNAIGRIGAFHLFRLPVEQEESLDIKISTIPPETLLPLITSRESALAALGEMESSRLIAASGPVQVGIEKQLGNPATGGSIAAHYLAAFKYGAKAFPYFAKDKHA